VQELFELGAERFFDDGAFGKRPNALKKTRNADEACVDQGLGNFERAMNIS
jgi:hypothetical protein